VIYPWPGEKMEYKNSGILKSLFFSTERVIVVMLSDELWIAVKS